MVPDVWSHGQLSPLRGLWWGKPSHTARAKGLWVVESGLSVTATFKDQDDIQQTGTQDQKPKVLWLISQRRPCKFTMNYNLSPSRKGWAKQGIRGSSRMMRKKEGGKNKIRKRTHGPIVQSNVSAYFYVPMWMLCKGVANVSSKCRVTPFLLGSNLPQGGCKPCSFPLSCCCEMLHISFHRMPVIAHTLHKKKTKKTSWGLCKCLLLYLSFLLDKRCGMFLTTNPLWIASKTWCLAESVFHTWPWDVGLRCM